MGFFVVDEDGFYLNYAPCLLDSSVLALLWTTNCEASLCLRCWQHIVNFDLLYVMSIV
jgi:hypothetical protein